MLRRFAPRNDEVTYSYWAVMPEAFDDRRQLFIIGFRQCGEFVGASELPLNVGFSSALLMA